MAACLLGVLLLAPATTTAAVYRYIDKQGRVYFTDKPEHSGYRKLVQTWKGWREPSFDARQFRANQRRFAPLLAEVAREQSLPDALVHAVVTAESAYDPDALSSAGAVGLMQLMPATARRFGVTNRNNPRDNVTGGTRYLRVLIDLFGNDLRLALAAYNAGENAVIRHGRKVPPYPETQRYVRKVLDYYRKYRDEGVPAG
ncbi:MAG: transglycosylase SLT domain-containing protein [Gammaproteobacteria bacterium]|jgi:soluble lytic murein transglycosylase-like protein|nr:transglycosylase SLT domain-containing protein [Gammaproteobacteria bacterium]